MPIGLSVVIPAYNEEGSIAACIKSIDAVLNRLGLDSEIIVVNDGSTDRTGEVAGSFVKKIKNLKVITNKPNRGYGGSLRAGFAAASKDFIAFIPGDNQFDFSEITKLLEKQAATGADIVSGIRVGGGVDPLPRKINRWGWKLVIRLLFGRLATDIDCGFKLFRKSILNQIHLTAERGAMIDTQMFAGALSRGFTIAEVPLTHLPRIAGKSTGANLRVIYQSFIDLFRYWWQLKKEIRKESGNSYRKWEIIGICLILAVAAFSRLYRISAYMTFLGDEGRDVTVVRDMLIGQKFTLLGPGTSVGNMYLGPLYYYLMLVPLRLSNFSPVGPALQIALLGIFTVAFLWWIGRTWYGRLPALLVAFLYSVSPVVIFYSRSSWNPNIMPFFSLLTIYSLWQFAVKKHMNWIIVTAVSFAFVLNSHYLGLLLLPVILIYWLKNRSLKPTVAGIIIFLVLMSPLFFFDLRHDWTNLKSIYNFFTVRQTTVNLKIYKAIPNLWPVWVNILTRLTTAGNTVIGELLAICLLLFVIVKVFTRKISPELLLLLLWLGFALIGFGVYKQHIYDHYYGFIFTAPFLLIGFSLQYLYSHLPLKIISTVVVGGLIVLNLIHSPLLSQPNNQLTRTRNVADFINAKAAGNPYNLALISDHNYDASYRYFLTLSGSPYYTLHDKLTDQLFVICEIPDCRPVNNPLWEVAAFGWSKIDNQWNFPWAVTVYRLVHNPSGK